MTSLAWAEWMLISFGQMQIDNIVINNFPIPPSDNNIKKPVQRFAKGGFGKVLSFVDTKDYSDYKRELLIYRARFNPLLMNHATMMQKWINDYGGLRIEVTFNLNKSTIFTKKNEAKRWDVTNRIKGLLDGLTSLLEIDDKNYWECEVKKVSHGEDKKEVAQIKIMPIKIKAPGKVDQGLTEENNQPT